MDPNDLTYEVMTEKIRHEMTERQMRVALLSILEGKSLKEALIIALSYA
jgi:hypothetical protein